MPDHPQSEPIVVLESLRRVRPTTNPYLVQLIDALDATPGVTVELFSFAHGILGRYDVFHVHWPETLFTSAKATGRWYRRVLTAAFLARLWITRTPVVRTWHNLERPSGLGRIDHWLLDGFDRLTTLRIGLNEQTEFPADGKPTAIVLHGHYRDWYGRHPQAEAVSGRIGYAGAIRRYKGVESLVAAFTALPDPAVSLRVAGKLSSSELGDEITRLAASDPRVSYEFGFLEEPDFVAEITASELVVLPYRHMHNSGIALACLSLGRPVLVPDNEVNRRLADEVGPGWVHVFADQVTAADLAAALDDLRRNPPVAPPDLSRREWTAMGAEHAAAFRRALASHRR